MSAINSITNLFNLKDPNIDFSNFKCKYELINNVNTMIIELGMRTYSWTLKGV